jgi:CRISPR-associated protein Cas2
MWVFVYFDLPTETKENRKDYTTFRKGLLMDGFNMVQYSVYARHCSSRENAKVHINRIKKIIPPYGEVIIFEITDAQFGQMEFFKGIKPVSKTNQPIQLELF